MSVNQTLDNVCVPVNALLDSISGQPISKHQGSSGLYTYVLFFIFHPINIPLSPLSQIVLQICSKENTIHVKPF